MTMNKLYLLMTSLAFSVSVSNTVMGQVFVNLSNAGFEQWTGEGLPAHWFGSASNLAASNVQDSEDAYLGTRCCRLVRTQKSHARFSSCPMALSKGNYRMNYYVKGVGAIRNTYYSGSSYANYSEFDTLQTSVWQLKTYEFELKKDLDSLQLVFSICQTDTVGLFIDEVSLAQLPSTGLSDVADASKVSVSVSEKIVRILTEQPLQVTVTDLSGRECISAFTPLECELPEGLYIVRIPETGVCRKVLVP